VGSRRISDALERAQKDDRDLRPLELVAIFLGAISLAALAGWACRVVG
jgi:hypothetical protein